MSWRSPRALPVYDKAGRNLLGYLDENGKVNPAPPETRPDGGAQIAALGEEPRPDGE